MKAVRRESSAPLTLRTYVDEKKFLSLNFNEDRTEHFFERIFLNFY